MSDLIKSSALLFILLNPFLLVVYMIDVYAKLPPETFRSVVFYTGIISSFVFAIVALLAMSYSVIFCRLSSHRLIYSAGSFSC